MTDESTEVADAPADTPVQEPLARVSGKPLVDLPKDLYIPPDALAVFLEAFEGPLDLLLYLIRRQNMNILDIDVSEITRQYMDYIGAVEAMRFELAAEYLVMAAMLAGILVQFGMQLFNAAESNWVMVLLLLSTFFITRLFWPRLALVSALCVGVFYLLATQALHASALHWFPAIPVWQSPAWNLGGLLGVALPLFLVTLSAQNLPGVAMMQSYGYQPPISPLITTTGVVGLLLAPFGGFAFNLAAITAALCLNPDAHPDPKKRYHAAVWAGLFYLGCGLGGAALIQFFLAMPKPFIAAIAGLALIGTISQSFGQAFSEPAHRESALFAFLTTASGISLFNIGSAFWGLLCGLIVHHLFRSANTPT